MILKLYDLQHTLIGGLKNHKDAVVESELSTGDKTLSFSWHQRNKLKIPHEYYVRTDKDEFVVKENSKGSNGYRSIVARLNLEEIEGRIWDDYVVEECTAQYAADYALADTGWSCISTVSEERLRNISLKKVNSYKILEKISEAFTCEVEYDTFQKIVYLKEKVGEDKGVYFATGINLKEVSDSGDTYDYATRIIPIGADGLDITEVNDGKRYLENYQYSNKVKTIIWEDTNYTDAEALKADAEYKLNEISKPKKTLQAKVVDLAKIKPEYGILSYSVGDTVTLMDNKEGIHEKQRITKTTEYLNHPEKNTCDISNTVLSFEEMQKKLFAAAECIGNVTTDNGTIKGSSVDAIDVTQIIGLERYVAEDIDDLKVNYLYVRSEFGTPYAIIGNGVLTQANVTNLNVTGREDSALSYITELHATNTYGEYAKFGVVEADNIAALESRIDKITATEVNTEYLEANYAQINMANVDTASIRQGFLESLMVEQGIIADRVVSGEVTATRTLTGVNLYADDIIAGTLSVDRLILRGTDKSLVYALNNSGDLISEQVDTLDAYILTDRTITADKIVAESITSTEIDVADLIATGFVEANRITAKNIFVDDLEALGATIGGFTIGAKYLANNTTTLAGASDSVYVGLDGISCGKRFKVTHMGFLNASAGEIGGFTIGSTALYNGTNSKTSTTAGIYMGTDAIRAYGSASAYTHIESGKLTCTGANIKGSLYLDNGLYMYHTSGANEEAGYSNILSWKTYADSFVISASRSWWFNSSVNIGEGLYVENSIGAGSDISANGAVYASNWFRTYGNTGWRSQTHGGGWYMTDSTYIRNYNSKHLLLSGDCYFGSTSHFINSSGGAKLTHAVLTKGYVDALDSKGTQRNLISHNTSDNVHIGTGDNLYNVHIHSNGYELLLVSSAVRPTSSVYPALGGSGAYRWGQVYSTKSAISTSDRNEKKDITDIPDIYMELFKKLQPKAFMFKDGDRIHIGAVAQDVEEAMIELGMTNKEFGGFCKDKITREIRDENGDPVGEEDVLDEDGNVQYTYGLRYEEFIMLTVYMLQKTIKRVDNQEGLINTISNQLYNVQIELKKAQTEIERLKAVA